MGSVHPSSTDKIREKKRQFLAREQRIVERALRCLLRDGIDQVTVAAIAEEAGIGKGTVYKHFQSKSEILARILIDYESRIRANMDDGIAAAEAGNPGAMVKAYFHSRLSNPELDRLVQQLEERIQDDPLVEKQVAELHEMRRTTTERIGSMVRRLIDRGVLEDVPPHYHYLACWALAQGAVDVCFNKGFADQFGDKEDLLRFITGIGMTMGNKGQLRDI
jgi:AcrR family transcriptional regulator